LQEAALLLRERLDYPLLVQGDASKSQLLASFCIQENAILLGTSSFWEGVDVKGSRLSCVIIDKIPFMVPDDPILKARIDYYKKQGKNAFVEYQLPHAVIALRQGAGRLIRDSSDQGILMLCDPRLISKDYGKVVLDSLPPMRITKNIDDVAFFLQSMPA
jgi:ATP-dependent DNA helicase DinG